MVNAPSASNQSRPQDNPKTGECPPDHKLPENTQAHLDTQLDHAIEETFPTSDPISVNITKGGAIDYDQQNATPAASHQAEQDTAENLLDRTMETLHHTMGSASGAVRDAYAQGQRYIHHARERYPEAEHYYQEYSRTIRQKVSEHPWLSLLVAGALGYGIAWMIHGRRGEHAEPVPNYARTNRGHTPHRN